MASLFDPQEYQAILARLDALRPDAARQWGTMTAAQTLEHTARALEMAAGKRPTTRPLIGKLIGWIFLRTYLGAKDFDRNSPTGPDLIIAGEPDFAATKARLRDLLADFHRQGPAGCDGNLHGFFGRLSGPEWGIIQHKHLDHHLRQFGR